ncbi:MAG: DUF1232 domain-containing protein [Deltaproteobacteria bacterium]|nr:DUF1232 domain-containing protein [Deltaproteobacteria bacterium]
MLQYFRLWRIVLSILALVYTFSPYDFLPDMLVGWGWLDDIAILYLLWHFFYRGRKTPVNADGERAYDGSKPEGYKRPKNTLRHTRSAQGGVPGRDKDSL